MAVQLVATSANGANVTMFGLSEHVGDRLIMVAVDRSGGVTAQFAGVDSTLAAAMLPVVSEAGQAGDLNSRRSVFMLAGIIPSNLSSGIIGCQSFDALSMEVANSWIAVVVDEAAAFDLAGIADASSGGTTTTTQATGTTGTVGAGDLLIVAAETTRGVTTVAWDTTTDTPANPGGGTWDLNVASGTGNNQRRGSMGYAALTGQPSQTWDDVVTLGTARMASAVIAVWSTGTETTPQVTTDIPLTLTVDPHATAMHSVTADLPLTLTVDGVTSAPQVPGATVTTTIPLTATVAAVTAAPGEVALIDLHVTALTPVLDHGPALTPATVTRTALAPATSHGPAVTPTTVDRAAGNPELGHGDGDDPQLRHGDPDATLAHGAPSQPTT